MSEMTQEKFDKKIQHLVRQRDYCCDEIGNVFLGLTYQQDIDKLVEKYPEFVEPKTKE